MWVTGLILYCGFLIGAFFIQAVASAFRALEHTRSTEQLRATQSLYVYRAYQRLFFRRHELETLFFCISCTKELTRFGLAIGSLLLLFGISRLAPLNTAIILAIVFVAIGALIIALALGDFLPRYWGLRFPVTALHAAGPAASAYLLLASPICYLCLLIAGRSFSNIYLEQVREPVGTVKEKILEMLEQAQGAAPHGEEEREMLESVVELRDTIVREVMVPRVNMFCVPSTMSVRDAAQLLDEEGYSRAPVYEGSIDKIVGLLLYKDLARLYVESEKKGDTTLFDQTVAPLIKPAPFIPETSRVSRLLEEFKRKQTHLAIVVDEYGGTEGLVTIEDCLEEIVGEIADEHDEAAELYSPAVDGGWIVDAHMPISDIEEKFGIKVPQEGDYDTIGGYAFHKAGEIPPKGLRIHHDEFELEVVESSERCVERVWIKPAAPKK